MFKRELRHMAVGLAAFLVITSTNQLTAESTRGSAKANGSSSIPQVVEINRHIHRGWADHRVVPSRPASDGEFCRRVFLDVLGRIPSTSELEQYTRDRTRDKKLRLINRLLYSYRNEYARNWSTIWTNILIGRSDRRNSPTNRQGMSQYLRDSFARNKPYDRLVYELVACTGGNKPGAENFNGAVNFLIGKLDENAAQATAQTARVFLGLRVQCTQCHNHPFNESKQNQFWQMNAFFRQTTALRRFEPGTRNVDFFELANQDFPGEDRPMDAQNARVYYELRNGKLEAAFPVFIDGTEIGRSGYVEDVDRRTELANLVVRSDCMPRAIVNRMWSHFCGYGFTTPIDDMGEHNHPVHAELLDYLASQLNENSFDLKQLIAWIVLSDPYGLSSRTNSKNRNDDPELGEPPKFSRFYLRQMTAEQLYESLIIASEADKTHAGPRRQEKAKRDWLRQFTIAFGTDEGDEMTTFDGTIAQALMMFNGDLIKRATNGEPGSFLYRVASDQHASNGAKIDRLFMAGLSRRPTKLERRVANQLVVAHGGDVTAALQDVWWAILNSNEFILNH